MTQKKSTASLVKCHGTHVLTLQSQDELALVLRVCLHEGDEGPRGLVHHAAVVALPVPELGQQIGDAFTTDAGDLVEFHGLQGHLLVELDEVYIGVLRREQE